MLSFTKFQEMKHNFPVRFKKELFFYLNKMKLKTNINYTQLHKVSRNKGMKTEIKKKLRKFYKLDSLLKKNRIAIKELY